MISLQAVTESQYIFQSIEGTNRSNVKGLELKEKDGTGTPSIEHQPSVQFA